MHTFTTSQWVPYPVELVFAFFANPNNLPHLTPKWQKARIEDLRLQPPPLRPLAANPEHRFQSPAAGAGSELLVSMRLAPGLPMRAGWQLRIAEFAWYDHFQDELVKGPFAAWRHTHHVVREEMREEMREATREKKSTGTQVGAEADDTSIAAEAGTDGTRITDELSYELPLGPLGELAHAIFVRRQIESTFAFRRQRLTEILPVAARQAARRQ